jgi:EAL domain-containing protein (putative c-di-GMP-specific phosphodiesterase class I)
MEHGKPSTAADGPLIDFDAVCRKVRAAVEPARAHAVSLHDERGEVLWLSESSMGPDEHGAVREAIQAFSDPGSPGALVYDLGDSHSAVLLRAVNGRRTMVGAIMIVVDSRFIKQDGRGTLMVMTPKLQRALNDFAEMRPDGAPPPAMPATSKAPAPPTLVDEVRAPASPLSLLDETPSAPLTPATGSPASSTPAATAGKRPQATVTPQIDRLHAVLRRSPIVLHIQRLVPLTKGSQLKRYEVLLRSKWNVAPDAAPQGMLQTAVENGLGSMIDRRVLIELIGYLVRHPQIWKTTALQFSVNLTVTALHDEHFIKFVGLCLAKASLPKGMIAFEIDTPTAVKFAGKMTEVAAALQRLDCPLILDDFAMKTECFALLRLPGIRGVKLAPAITTAMRSDKLSQAAITAVVQMARVLGMHTVAKHTETAAEHEWLTALGVDFVQSNSMSAPVALDSLSKTANPARPPAPTHPPTSNQ